MIKKLKVNPDLLFEVTDVFGKQVRTTKPYWKKIITEKHADLSVGEKEVKETLSSPDEVRQSIQDQFIQLYYKSYDDKTLIVVVKYLNNHGFVVTCYQTTKVKRKGIKTWPK